MKSTREKILRTLLSFPGSTINNLAESVGINGISIRHHLTALEAEDLVTSAEERHGVGRPRLIYSLTDKGVEKFPTSYLKLTKRLLNSIKEQMSTEEISEIFGDIGAEIANSYVTNLAEKQIEERLNLLKSLMTKEGFIIEWEKNEDSYTLTSLSCPYFQIGLEHPEVCALDYALISKFFSTQVEIESCMFNNADCCTYRIPIINKEKKND
jgi:DeoR family transcriptional regulator, suf operon transcriptional repressor